MRVDISSSTASKPEVPVLTTITRLKVTINSLRVQNMYFAASPHKNKCVPKIAINYSFWRKTAQSNQSAEPQKTVTNSPQWWHRIVPKPLIFAGWEETYSTHLKTLHLYISHYLFITSWCSMQFWELQLINWHLLSWSK